MTTKKRIAVVPGDGIGKEVIPNALEVLRASGAALEFTHFDWGADRYLLDGTTMPAGGFDMLAHDFDAIFVGALGDPRVPSNIHAKEILLGMRFEMDLYANVRPVRLLDESLCPLKNAGVDDVNFTVIRENTEGRLRRHGRQLQIRYSGRNRHPGRYQHPQRCGARDSLRLRLCARAMAGRKC